MGAFIYEVRRTWRGNTRVESTHKTKAAAQRAVSKLKGRLPSYYRKRKKTETEHKVWVKLRGKRIIVSRHRTIKAADKKVRELEGRLPKYRIVKLKKK